MPKAPSQRPEHGPGALGSLCRGRLSTKSAVHQTDGVVPGLAGQPFRMQQSVNFVADVSPTAADTHGHTKPDREGSAESGMQGTHA
eukprot:2133-Alexandrium_andersonii.AAC.1